MSSFSTNDYVLGHHEAELERLERQARLFAGPTEDGLRSAGLCQGMRVLDLGCGVGDVSLAAASVVGPEGSVLGVDRSAEAVETARRRFAGLGIGWARCGIGNIDAVDFGGYDAIVGRFILMHLPRPSELMARLSAGCSPGTVLAFLEMDVTSASITPALPLFGAGLDAIVRTYRAEGVEPDMGSKLYATFRAAGLCPALKAWCHIAGDDAPDAFDFLSRTVSSLAPAIAAAGLMQPELDPATYGDRLLSAAAGAHHCVQFPRLVCAWARTGPHPPAVAGPDPRR